MADWIGSKLRAQSRYHFIPGPDTLAHNTQRAHVIFHMKDVEMGPGFGDRLRKGLDDFLRALEAKPKDHVIGMDYESASPKATYGNAPAGALLSDFDDLIKVAKTPSLDLDTLKKDIGEHDFGTASLLEMRQYVREAVEYRNAVRCRIWSVSSRQDPVWEWKMNNNWRNTGEVWHKGVGDLVHQLNIATDCFSAQGTSTGQIGGVSDHGSQLYSDLFRAVYGMSSQEAAELVRFAVLRGETWAATPDYRRVMHMHLQRLNAYVNWRAYFVAQARREWRVRAREEGVHWMSAEQLLEKQLLGQTYWPVLQQVAPYGDVYIDVVYAMARSLQQAPNDLGNFYRLDGSANRLHTTLISRINQLAFTEEMVEGNVNFTGDFMSARFYVRFQSQWANHADRRKPFNVFRSMLAKEPLYLPDERSLPEVLFEEKIGVFNQTTVKAQLLQDINLGIDGALAPTVQAPQAPWASQATPAPQAPQARPLNPLTTFANVVADPSNAPVPRKMVTLGRGRGRGGGLQPQQGGTSRKRKTVSLWDQEDEDGLFSETSDEDQEDTIANRVIKQYRPLWTRNGSQRQGSATAENSVTNSKKRGVSPEFESRDSNIKRKRIIAT